MNVQKQSGDMRDTVKIPNPFPEFHRNTEKFFKQRKKEATPAKAILAFLAMTLLVSIWLTLDNYAEDMSIVLLIPLTSLIKSFFSNSAAFGGLFLLPVAFVIWVVGKVMFKSKAGFFEILYVWSLPFILLFVVSTLAFILGSIFIPLAYIPVPLLLLIPYALIVGMKIVHNLGYGKTILLVILSNGIAGFARLPLFLVWGLIVVSPGNIEHVSNVTYNDDGSTTFGYAYAFKDSGDVREACVLNVPSGWKSIDNETKLLLETKLGKELGYRHVFFKNLDEFIIFDSSIPQGGYSEGIDKNSCEVELEISSWMGYGFDADMNAFYAEYLIIPETSSEVCHKKIYDLNRTSVRHTIGGAFLSTGLGYYAIYQSPAGQDQDLDYIIQHIRCYN